MALFRLISKLFPLSRQTGFLSLCCALLFLGNTGSHHKITQGKLILSKKHRLTNCIQSLHDQLKLYNQCEQCLDYTINVNNVT